MTIQTLDNGHFASGQIPVPLGQTKSELAEINIRHVELADREGIYQLMSEPQIVYWTAGLPFAPTLSIKKFYQPDSNQYPLVATTPNNMIGFILLSVYRNERMRHAGRIGPVAVSKAWQGYGIGSRLVKSVIDLADNWLNLRRLELLVYNDNQSGIALYSKYGFEPEGLARQLAFRAGKYVDALMMGRLNP